MKILWFAWKDKKHPLAGGAETVDEELAKRLAGDGHEVIFLVGGFDGGQKEEMVGGYKIIRLGNRWTVYWRAYKYYKKKLIGWADLVIDEVNTMPFFCRFFVKEKNIILSYQLCREIWFHQMFFPLSLIGYLIEPVYLWLLRDRIVLTESESTKKDMQKYGFRKDNIFVFPVGLESEPVSKSEFLSQKKADKPTMLYFGSIRSMKQPDCVLRAFEIAKEKIPSLIFFIAGSGDTGYFKKFLNNLKKSKFSADIVYFGKVDNKKKLEIMRNSHIICATSVKEGWGLIVTEANSCGTPAAVYDSDGLRDACKNNVTGLVCGKNTPSELAKNIINLFKNREFYNNLRYNAYLDSRNYNYENSYRAFTGVINKLENIKKA